MQESLISHLPPTVAARYQEILPGSLRRQFEDGLHTLLRWNNSEPHKTGFRQSVLDHTITCVKWAKTLMCLRALPHEVDIPEVVSMLIGHDVGEFYGGDMDKNSAHYSSRSGERKKYLQFIGAYRFLFSQIPNGDDRQYVRELYSRFEAVSGKPNGGVYRAIDSQDKEALLARLIDLMEGNRTAVTHFYDCNKLPAEKVTEEFKRKRLNLMLGETTEIYLQLQRLLSFDASDELRIWWEAQIDLYIQAGYESGFYIRPPSDEPRVLITL